MVGSGQMQLALGQQQIAIPGPQSQIGGQLPVQLSVQSAQQPTLQQPPQPIISAQNSIFQVNYKYLSIAVEGFWLLIT